MDEGWVQAAHPDPVTPTAMISLSRAAFYGTTPSWPATMIDPTASEMRRWAQLWACPEAAGWIQARQEQAVAQLVRLEQRAGRRRSSAAVAAELDRARTRLGLIAGS